MAISDISETRLAVAKEMGADHTVLVKTKDGKQLAKRVESTLDAMPDITIECSGAESSIQTGIYVRFSCHFLYHWRKMYTLYLLRFRRNSS